MKPITLVFGHLGEGFMLCVFIKSETYAVVMLEKDR